MTTTTGGGKVTKTKAVATTDTASKDVAVVEQGTTALAVAGDNDLFADYADAGFENVTNNDILIPRISILQDLSPQVKEEKAEYIEGA
jgi:hypothetical protein